MSHYLFILVGAVLVNNVVLVKILGLCPFMGVSKKLETAYGMGAATTFVLTMATGASYIIDHYLLLPFGLEYLRTLSFIVTIAVLHLGNNSAVPISIFSSKSYIVWSGVQDAMVQWWYGHNAVGFFLTAGFLGMMYYFVPKQAGRPVYSYRLSVVHFWALIFTYMWAGPHHLHYTALPDWTQSLGMVMSLILLAPSWGSLSRPRSARSRS